jgi:hypothetical protein
VDKRSWGTDLKVALLFLIGGTLSFLLSVGLWFLAGDRETAMYVGLWVPSVFALGTLVLAARR